ncbi:MAG TPA: transcription termination factor Rho [Deltaproteobacteria bacterium]|nr:transcription termination factor Rho [Deltaproteobacteria bacterium]
MTEDTKKKSQKEEKPLDKMTVKELKEIAMAIPHDHTEIAVSDMKKDQLLSFIKEAQGISDEKPEKKVKKTAEKIPLSKGEIKAKIKDLQKEKQAVRNQNDEKLVRALRRRISRLKKMSRKIA